MLEDSLAEFPGALVLVSHDRDLMDRLCTEVVGLDGRGGAALYGSVEQWLAAYERATAESREARRTPRSRRARPRRRRSRASSATASSRNGSRWRPPSSPPRKRSAERQAEVERAATAGHVALADACRALEEAQRAVERLYARWQELEAKRG